MRQPHRQVVALSSEITLLINGFRITGMVRKFLRYSNLPLDFDTNPATILFIGAGR